MIDLIALAQRDAEALRHHERLEPPTPTLYCDECDLKIENNEKYYDFGMFSTVCTRCIGGYLEKHSEVL